MDGNYIYWTNGATGTIGRANLNGGSGNQSFTAGLGAIELAAGP